MIYIHKLLMKITCQFRMSLLNIYIKFSLLLFCYYPTRCIIKLYNNNDIE